MQAKRAWWQAEMMNLNPRRLVFIDETWTKTNMTRLRGRAIRGRRVHDRVPHGHWKTTTLIAALDHRGIRCSMVLDGPVNREAFEAFIEQVLLPRLAPGDIVVMDNLSSHKGPVVHQRIHAAGGELVYLPPYSPDFNPIEQAFSKIKQHLRSLACRTVDSLWGTMQSVLETVTPSDAVGYYQHCGYATNQLKPL